MDPRNAFPSVRRARRRSAEEAALTAFIEAEVKRATAVELQALRAAVLESVYATPGFSGSGALQRVADTLNLN